MQCSTGFDHHCPFLNQCIGEENYNRYFALLISFVVFMLFTTVISIYVLLEAHVVDGGWTGNFENVEKRWGRVLFDVLVVVLGIIGLIAGVGIYLTVLKLDIAIIRLNRTTTKFASRWSAGGSMPLRVEADFYPFEDEDATNKLKRVVDSRIFSMLNLNVARVFQALLDKAGPIVAAERKNDLVALIPKHPDENLKELFSALLPMDADAENGIHKKELQRAIEALELDVDDGTIEGLFKQFDTKLIKMV